MEHTFSLLLNSFICSLFNDAVSNPGYTAPNDWMTGKNELETMPRPDTSSYPRHLPEGTEGYQE
jgi:hypothetical protein